MRRCDLWQTDWMPPRMMTFRWKLSRKVYTHVHGKRVERLVLCSIWPTKRAPTNRFARQLPRSDRAACERVVHCARMSGPAATMAGGFRAARRTTYLKPAEDVAADCQRSQPP